MKTHPSGIVTFLFTDIEGSTRKWEKLPDGMSYDLSLHDRLMRRSIEERGGYVFKTVGDAFCAAFSDPREALIASVEAQRRLATAPWTIPGGLPVRMALHAGSAEERDEDYFGPVVNRAARLLSLVYGGQLLCSLAASELLADHLPEGFLLLPLGQFRLKDLARAERISQVLAPGLRERFPALKSLDGQPNNLPLQPSAFIGREREIATVLAALDPGRGKAPCRLLTLLGPGGAGKTRLALQAGAELLDSFPGGAWFVDLSEARDGPATLCAVNRALGVREGEGRGPARALAEQLGERPVLLILDNLEQDPDAGPIIADLLVDCPGLSVIATSREALRLRWERLLPIPPMGLPERGGPLGMKSLRQYEAVELFIERARAVRPDFRVDDRSAPAIAEICIRLDGIPLAIELAAARARAFSSEEILRRLEADLGFLDSGGVDLPARQRTLRAAARWSYDLLEEADRAAFRALGAFSSVFSLESAEFLLDSMGNPALAAGSGSLRIASLVEKSLVQPEAAEGEGSRYRMLEMLRSYARELLSSGGSEAEIAYRAHSRRYSLLAAEGRGSGPDRLDEADFYGRLDLEYADYMAAASRLLATGEAAESLAVAVGLSNFWAFRGMLAEGTSTLEAAAAAYEASPGAVAGAPLRGPSAETGVAEARAMLLGRALRCLGDLYRARGDYGAALERYTRSGESAGAAEDPLGEAEALAGIGWIRFLKGQRGEARELFESAIASAERLDGGAIVAARARQGLGSIAIAEERFEEARVLLAAALAVYEAQGTFGQAASAASNLGILELMGGNRVGAKALFEKSRACFESIGDLERLMMADNNLGEFEFEDGAYEPALERYRRVEVLARSTAMGRLLALALAGEAECLAALGRCAEAGTAAGEALEASAAFGDCVERASALRARAMAERGEGRTAEAMSHIAEAEEILSRIGEGYELSKTVKARERMGSGGGAALAPPSRE